MKRIKERISLLRKALVSEEGFTFIELMIAVTIIAILSGISITVYRNYLQRTKVTAAKVQIRQFLLPLNTSDQIPTTEEGLNRFVQEGLIKQSALKDPWGNPYQYQSPGDNGEDFVIWSYGADGKAGGDGYDKDILNTDLE